jgi:hypothetical protein
MTFNRPNFGDPTSADRAFRSLSNLFGHPAARVIPSAINVAGPEEDPPRAARARRSGGNMIKRTRI